MHLHSDLQPDQAPKAVTVSLHDLEKSNVSLEVLESALGPTSLGIILVRDLPPTFLEQRARVLSYASHLAKLPPETLCNLTRSAAKLESPSSKYLTGWSHGKESLQHRKFDTKKASFYFNCVHGDVTAAQSHARHCVEYPEMTTPNIWPNEQDLPGFQASMTSFCSLILKVAKLVARACDTYAAKAVDDYRPHFLENVVETSPLHKARLLHYFPADPDSHLISSPTDLTRPSNDHNDHNSDDGDDDWCTTHIDSSCLTGLTSAMLVDENQLVRRNVDDDDVAAVFEPVVPDATSSSGLYIKARDGTPVKVSIPADCLAFQTGEALQIATKGQFPAVPHFVKAGSVQGRRVARNTLAIFMQPDIDDILDSATKLSFGEFSKIVARRFDSQN